MQNRFNEYKSIQVFPQIISASILRRLFFITSFALSVLRYSQPQLTSTLRRFSKVLTLTSIMYLNGKYIIHVKNVDVNWWLTVVTLRQQFCTTISLLLYQFFISLKNIQQVVTRLCFFFETGIKKNNFAYLIHPTQLSLVTFLKSFSYSGG